MTLPPLITCVWGVQNTQEHVLRPKWTKVLARDSRINLRHTDDTRKHTRPTTAFHTTAKSRNMLHATAISSPRTHPNRPRSWAGSMELTRNELASAHRRSHRAPCSHADVIRRAKRPVDTRGRNGDSQTSARCAQHMISYHAYDRDHVDMLGARARARIET